MPLSHLLPASSMVREQATAHYREHLCMHRYSMPQCGRTIHHSRQSVLQDANSLVIARQIYPCLLRPANYQLN